MARPKAPSPTQMSAPGIQAALGPSAAVYRPGRKVNPQTDRAQIAKPWQVEAYRYTNICGEARYAATLFSATAGRAEIGVSEPNALARKAVWVTEGPEVEAFNELVPSVRDRSKLIRDFMLHWVIAGEAYLISRQRVDTDPSGTDDSLWEIVGVTELQKIGETWRVRHENGNYVDLRSTDPVIRMWNPDPANRMEAWSPFRAMLPTLREIEWLTKHIFTQVRSRLMGAGVWFVPDNLTFAPPPPDRIEGGADAIAQMNEAEQFMMSLAASSLDIMEADEVSFPSVVMADPAALERIDQKKLIQFWSEIDDKAMTLRTDAIRRFSLGMDLPPEQILGATGVAVAGSGGSAGSANHWSLWAVEEQTIVAHIEPALDSLVGFLTSAYLRNAVDKTTLVIGYDTANLRLRQDRSKEAMEWYDRGGLKLDVALRETGFDPESDKMDDAEFRRWLLTKIAGGSATPEQVNESLRLLGVVLNVDLGTGAEPAPAQPGRNAPRSLKDHPYEGPPREDHEHNEAPFSAFHASAEGLVLRALEKAGNRLLNDRTRGKDKDRTTPLHMAHVVAGGHTAPEFDLGLVPTVFGDRPAAEQAAIGGALRKYCADLYVRGQAYSRETLIAAVEGL